MEILAWTEHLFAGIGLAATVFAFVAFYVLAKPRTSSPLTETADPVLEAQIEEERQGWLSQP